MTCHTIVSPKGLYFLTLAAPLPRASAFARSSASDSEASVASVAASSTAFNATYLAGTKVAAGEIVAEFVLAAGANATAVGTRTAKARRLSLVIFIVAGLDIRIYLLDCRCVHLFMTAALHANHHGGMKILLRKSREVSRSDDVALQCARADETKMKDSRYQMSGSTGRRLYGTGTGMVW